VNRQTAELVRALTAVTRHIPRGTTELLAGALPIAKQHEFARLLTELGDLLDAHADDQERGVIRWPAEPHEPEDDNPAES
jgi:hypothetical protein